MTTFLFDVSTLTQLALAREMARRTAQAGYGVSFSFSGDESSSICEAARRSADDLAAPFYVAAQFERDVPADAVEFRPEQPTILNRMRAAMFAGGPLNVPPSDDIKLWTKIIRTQQSAAAEIIARAAPRTVFVGEDGVSGNAALIAAARQAQVPVIVVPYGFGGREDFENYIEEKHREGSLRVLGDTPDEKLLAKRCRQWIRKTHYGPVVMFPPHMILAREAAGWSLPDPWTPLGGSADYVVVENLGAREHYRREGLPEEKLVDLGSPYCDVLAEALAEYDDCETAYRRSSKIAAGRTKVLISLPPSYHDTRPDTSEFEDYPAMCRAVVEMCSRRPNVECTLSIHPATPPDQREILVGLGVNVAEEWLLKLIPRHDVYFTTFSSTIRWAVACGKPVLNYDAYRFNLAIYDGVRAVTTRPRLAELATALSRLCDDEVFARTAASLSGERNRWGLLDGGNTRRILEFALRAGQRKPPTGLLRRIWNVAA